MGPFQALYVYDTDPIHRKMLTKSREEWKLEAQGMSKLQTYVQVKNFTEIGTMVLASLPRNQRSILSKFLCGIMPLAVETGRYVKLDREIGFCKMCKGTCVEDEMHFLFSCSALQDAREESIETLVETIESYSTLSNYEKTKCLLDKANIKEFGKALEKLYMYRKDVLFKPSHLS